MASTRRAELPDFCVRKTGTPQHQQKETNDIINTTLFYIQQVYKLRILIRTRGVHRQALEGLNCQTNKKVF